MTLEPRRLEQTSSNEGQRNAAQLHCFVNPTIVGFLAENRDTSGYFSLAHNAGEEVELRD